MSRRRWRRARSIAGGGRQRPLQPRPARGAAQGARRRRLGARGGAGLCRKAQAKAGGTSRIKFREVMMATPNTPLWEVFIRSRNGLAHKHVGSLHASDATLALQAARDIYTRRGEGLSIWVVPSSAITASDPAEKGMMFEPAESKIYRHPTFYDVPDEVGHM